MNKRNQREFLAFLVLWLECAHRPIKPENN
jgi:hypothetical protein